MVIFQVMRVIIFDQMGNVLNKFGCSKHLEFPNGVVVNDRQEIFISDNRAHCVKVFDYDGNFLRQIGGEGMSCLMQTQLLLLSKCSGQLENYSSPLQGSPTTRSVSALTPRVRSPSLTTTTTSTCPCLARTDSLFLLSRAR